MGRPYGRAGEQTLTDHRGKAEISSTTLGCFTSQIGRADWRDSSETFVDMFLTYNWKWNLPALAGAVAPQPGLF